jgi:predicted transcriptional regulator
MENDNIIDTKLELAAEIIAAYVGNNHVAVADLPALIEGVYSSLNNLGNAASAPVQEVVAPVPAVSIKKSVTPDYIICLEDGKQFKSMKRHLASKFGMTPDDYRRKWNLPSDYPMVAAGYSSKRSALALSLGLGRKKAEPAAEPVAAAPKGRGRKAAAQAEAA